MHYSNPALTKMEGLRVLFPRHLKAGSNLPKGLQITPLKYNPDYPVDRGNIVNLIIQSCEFSKVVVFEAPNKYALLFKCKHDDEKTTQFCDAIKALDAKVMNEMAGSSSHYPKELGRMVDRFRPMLKEDEYMGRATVEFRAEIPITPDGAVKDTVFFEMKGDGPVMIPLAEFQDKYKNRPCVAIVDFPYATVMNTGSKTISIKPIVKQLLLLPETKRMEDAIRDNGAFKFMDL